MTLSYKNYEEGLEHLINSEKEGQSYLDQFKISFPDGLNTASVLEICRAAQEPSSENKIRLMKICIADKNVEVTCPNGDVEKFHLSSADDGLDGIPLFQKEPLALIAISDAIYGHILKKSVRLSVKTQEAAAKTARA